MMTAENIRALIPQMKEWGQHTAAQLCHEAATEIESLQKERDMWIFNANVLQDGYNKLDKEVRELRRQNAALIEALRTVKLAFENDGVQIRTNNRLSSDAIGVAFKMVNKALDDQPACRLGLNLSNYLA